MGFNYWLNQIGLRVLPIQNLCFLVMIHEEEAYLLFLFFASLVIPRQNVKIYSLNVNAYDISQHLYLDRNQQPKNNKLTR